MYKFYFEKLGVWIQAKDFAKSVYQSSSAFPREEQFGITSQLRRSSLSISANIAEGFSRKSDKEKARFVNMAYSSGWETLNHLILAKELDFLKEEDYKTLRSQLEEISSQLNALHNTLKR